MRQFYNPALTDAERDELDWANWVVLMCGQALLGAVSDNMLAIAVRAPLGAPVDIFVALERDDPIDREEITDELPAELDVFLEARVLVRSHLWIGRDWRQGGWPGRDERRVFARRSA